MNGEVRSLLRPTEGQLEDDVARMRLVAETE